MNLFDRAVEFAVKAHEGQLRKDKSLFILHPLEVAVIAGTMTRDEAVLAAAVLHDTVEDTPVTADDILSNFGERVAELVASETEDKRPEQKASDTWLIRKEESLEVLKNCDDEGIKILWLSDKLSNMRAFVREYENVGDEFFSRFNQPDPEKQKWYFITIEELLSDLEGYGAYSEYKTLVHRLFDRF
ncbi:MAG: bifunctional (p)ppGpp synthetase/guanosine-3',5'-bis(diphosphate) 3'-pyrophosphohydrolase [Clostridia bacterium]|nr:bifunctional (p)ppGpp synthetase/guanosine-3',5'-bis(diphosphate) 3'-pyrophosphohydrolase [Clostridia bacterium]